MVIEPQTLDSAKALVIQCRKEATAAREHLRTMRAAFEALLSVQQASATAEETAADLVCAETFLRRRALEAYATTGSKHPIAGITIKERTCLEYEAAKALDWARQHGLCLALDVKQFEATAKAMKLDIVRCVMEPQAQLSKNLEDAVDATP